MAKAKTVFVCDACGADHPRWQGQCRSCGAWNTLKQLSIQPGSASASSPASAAGPNRPLRLADIPSEEEPKRPTPDAELNRVLDGGLVPGAFVLLGGEPGIGKSTLLLQLGMALDGGVLYATGEESARQIKLRADRLTPGLEAPPNPDLHLLAETDLDRILAAAHELNPQLLVLDSVQTAHAPSLEAPPGAVAQVREVALRLMRYAKESGCTVVAVGHVTKDGNLAGPKVLEHLVDTVLEFEGDRHQQYRLVRAVKNRFGPTPELGVYDMQRHGLVGVPNPSALFLSAQTGLAPGVAVGVSLQGSRPLLLELQALATPVAYGNPQRTATGVDLKRVHMLLAVLHKRCGLPSAAMDVFANVVGGLRVDDPALDLPLAAALASAYRDVPLDPRTVLIGEVGLTGEVRPVGRQDARLAEAAKLGFTDAWLAGTTTGPDGLRRYAVNRLEEALDGLGLLG